MSIIRPFAPLMPGLFAAACTVEPDYRPPGSAALGVPAGFPSRPAGSVAIGDDDLASWWRGFGDPVLTSLVERALACFGEVIGVVIALAASVALAPVLRVPFAFDVKINLLAFVFSAAIGVIFGYFPARRAASLNPTDALRHE